MLSMQSNLFVRKKVDVSDVSLIAGLLLIVDRNVNNVRFLFVFFLT